MAGIEINWAGFILSQMRSLTWREHLNLPFPSLLTRVFRHFDVDLSGARASPLPRPCDASSLVRRDKAKAAADRRRARASSSAAAEGDSSEEEGESEESESGDEDSQSESRASQEQRRKGAQERAFRRDVVRELDLVMETQEVLLFRQHQIFDLVSQLCAHMGFTPRPFVEATAARFQTFPASHPLHEDQVSPPRAPPASEGLDPGAAVSVEEPQSAAAPSSDAPGVLSTEPPVSDPAPAQEPLLPPPVVSDLSGVPAADPTSDQPQSEPVPSEPLLSAPAAETRVPVDTELVVDLPSDDTPSSERLTDLSGTSSGSRAI